MNLSNIDLVEKPTIIKILTAIDNEEYTYLYTALRESNEALRKALITCLCYNPLSGYEKAILILTTTPDSALAVRSAVLCLLMYRMKERQND